VRQAGKLVPGIMVISCKDYCSLSRMLLFKEGGTERMVQERNTVRLLHTGDLHIGMTYNSRNYPGHVRDTLVEARMRALAGLIDKANDNGCELVIITGDLFHRKNINKSIILKVSELLNRFSGSCIAVLPGNHDYYDEVGDLWKDFCENAPDSVLLLSELRPYELQNYGLDIVLYPAPCDTKHSHENRIGWIKELQKRPGALWHIGAAHGTVEGISPDLDGRYFPMTQGELEEASLDLWLLGHTHVPYPQLNYIENPPFIYCGTPEPDGFDCATRGQAWIVTLNGEKRTIACRAVRTGSFCFKKYSLTVNSLDELRRFAAELSQKYPEKNAVIKLTVSGILLEEEFVGRASVYEEIKSSVFYLEPPDDAGLKVDITPEIIRREFTEGSFPSKFLNRLSKEPEDKDALQIAYEMIRKVREK